MTISVSIPVVSGNNLKLCLDSIYASSYDDFEVVVNDSSENEQVNDILKQYDLKVIVKKTRTLESRFITVSNSKGDKVFLMDETRTIGKSLLREIENTRNRIIVIGEEEVGNSLVQRASNLEKRSSCRLRDKGLSPLVNKSVIPRVYERTLILKSFEAVRRKLSDELFYKIVGLDLELIYYESWLQTTDIGFIRGAEIYHLGESSYRELFAKYYRYGKTQKYLRSTEYHQLAGIMGRNRHGIGFLDRVRVFPIQVMRGIPFILGYISDESQRNYRIR